MTFWLPSGCAQGVRATNLRKILNSLMTKTTSRKKVLIMFHLSMTPETRTKQWRSGSFQICTRFFRENKNTFVGLSSVQFPMCTGQNHWLLGSLEGDLVNPTTNSALITEIDLFGCTLYKHTHLATCCYRRTHLNRQ
jgi:hypothetical protein